MARPGLLTHPKFRRLVHVLGVPVPHALGYLECLWGVCYERGDPLLGDSLDVELAAQWPGDKGKLFEALCECRFIDQMDQDRYQVHDLFDHAPEYVRKRMEREHTRKRAYKPRQRLLSAPWRAQAAGANGKADLGGQIPPSGDVSRTPAVIGSPPPPPPINTPLPPKGGKGARKKSADPERESVARRIVDHYQAAVTPAHDKGGGINNVANLLRDGLTEERLRAAADGYAVACRAKGIETKYRKNVRNFYGKEAIFKDYLDYQPGTAGPANQHIAAQLRAEREEWDRQRQAAQGVGLFASASPAGCPAGQEGVA
jgi:hypothetical protein